MKLPIPHEFHRAAHRFSALWSGAAGTVAYGRRAAGSAVDTLDDPIYGRSLELAAEHSSDRKPVRCLHCGVPIRVWTDPRDAQWWVHTGPAGTFWCRGAYGTIIDGQYATPPNSPAPPASRHAEAAPASTAHPRPATPYPTAVGSYPRELVDGLQLGRRA